MPWQAGWWTVTVAERSNCELFWNAVAIFYVSDWVKSRETWVVTAGYQSQIPTFPNTTNITAFVHSVVLSSHARKHWQNTALFLFQCESMVRAANESPWYEASEGFKRSIRIMVVRSMKPFRLTGGKLYVMSLETFVVVRCLLTYIDVLQ
jgi:hypothetical protein